MSSTINYIQNSLSIPSYNRQQQINTAERQISQIDRTVEQNNRTIALNNEQNAIRRELIANNDEFQKIVIDSNFPNYLNINKAKYHEWIA